jgi:putative tryptophan/tyrosine transport system substrate-binding protein
MLANPVCCHLGWGQRMQFGQLKRREFVTLLGCAAAWPLAARGQAPAKLLRLGIISASPRTAVFLVAFDQRLRELGYVEGQNLAVEFIYVGDRSDVVGEAMREIVRRKVDVIVDAIGTQTGLKAMLAVTTTLPILMVAVGYDPVASGYVTSIARPTGNVTGVYFRRPELVEKQLEILNETFPDKPRLGVLWDAGSADMFSATERAATSLKLSLRSLKLETPPYDFVTAFRTLAQADAQTLLVLSSVYFNRDRPHIAALALQHRMPTMFVSRTYAEAGGLMSYGPSISGMFQLVATYVDRIAHGTKPSDLPIEQPTKFELVLNLKTARALDLDVPPALLARADEVIE